jgi:hypothetical protein
MTGKRQHFIPQFLLRGFASRTRGKTTYAWVYRRESNPFEANTINTGVEKDFYTAGSDYQVDRKITQSETRYASIVSETLAVEPGPFYHDGCAEMFAHFEVRTRHLREAFLQGGDYMTTRLADFMADGPVFRKYVIKTLADDPGLLRKALRDELQRLGLPKSLDEVLLSIAKPALPELARQMEPSITAMAQGLKEVLPDKMRLSIKSGHLKALRRSAAPPVKTLRYEQLMFSVVSFDDGDLVLGDSIIIFNVNGPQEYRTFLDREDELRAVFLPLAPSRMLIGAYGPYEVDILAARRAIVRCSLEFFVSARLCEEHKQLSQEIGLDADLLSQNELEAIVDKVIGS